MNHARITHIFSFLEVDVRRWWFVCDYEFWTVKKCALFVRSLCVEYAWLCAGHASAVSASELVRNRACPLLYYTWTAHILRSFHWHPLTITYKTHECVFGRALSVIHASGVRWMFVEYYTVFARMRRRACQWFVSDCLWYVRGLCVIRQWCLSPTPHKIWSISRRTSTHKPNLCVICEWFVLCDWPFKDILFPARAPTKSLWHPAGSRFIFGGQVVGQALVAACNTVSPDHHVHSLHCYFLRGGKPFCGAFLINVY